MQNPSTAGRSSSLLVGIGLPVDRLSLFPPATPNEPRLPAFCAIHTALSFATTVRLMFGTATQIMEDNDGEENVDSNLYKNFALITSSFPMAFFLLSPSFPVSYSCLCL
jgi:hypothetical protein